MTRGQKLTSCPPPTPLYQTARPYAPPPLLFPSTPLLHFQPPLPPHLLRPGTARREWRGCVGERPARRHSKHDECGGGGVSREVMRRVHVAWVCRGRDRSTSACPSTLPVCVCVCVCVYWLGMSRQAGGDARRPLDHLPYCYIWIWRVAGT
jgi:hypothetical protein